MCPNSVEAGKAVKKNRRDLGWPEQGSKEQDFSASRLNAEKKPKLGAWGAGRNVIP